MPSWVHLAMSMYDLACGSHRAIDNQGEYERVAVRGERVDALVQEDVTLMKLDVEGFEPLAFESSKGILDGHSCVPALLACALLTH